MNRKLAIAVAIGLISTAALATGWLAAPPSGAVPEVFAIDCQPANGACGVGDYTKTSALEATYVMALADPFIEPEEDEVTSWSIMAEWRSPLPAPCYSRQEVATVDVAWNGSGWVLSNQNLNTNIVGITVCAGSDCEEGGGAKHSWNYKLIVNIKDPETVLGYNLKKVTYATTAVPDGNELDFDESRNCSLGTSRSPTSQTFTAYDAPGVWSTSYRCGFNCSVTGASTQINYE